MGRFWWGLVLGRTSAVRGYERAQKLSLGGGIKRMEFSEILAIDQSESRTVLAFAGSFSAKVLALAENLEINVAAGSS